MLGTVTDWDDPRGYGTVTGDDGTAYFLHCTSIADGSRTIDPGTPVSFDVRPGHGGWEATNVTPV